jgi:putative ABC transport system permease protein
MRLSSLVHLYRVRLNARIVLVQELFALAGIAVGVALLFASQVANTSLNGSVTALTSEIVGHMQYQLDTRAPRGFPQPLLGAVQRLPDVRAALPILEQNVNLVGPSGQRAVDFIGTDPHFALHGGPLLRHFSYAQISSLKAIALPAPIASAIGVEPLHPVELQIGARNTTALLGAELSSPAIGALVHSPVAVAPLGYAQKLTGMTGRLSRIFVQAAPGHERRVHAELERLAAGAINVEPANFDDTLFRVAAAPANQGEGLFSAISALVGFLFAINAMLLTLGLRRNLIRGLRASGATRSDTLKALLLDAFVLGSLASLLGLALGELLSIALFNANPGYLSFAFPLGSQRIVTWQSVATAVGAGLLAACIGVLLPLRDVFSRDAPFLLPSADRIDRFSRLRQSTSSIGGLVLLSATTIILLAAPQSAVLGSITLVLALLLLLPLLLDLTFAFVARLPGRLEATATRLAIAELRSPTARTRSLAIAATGAIAVFGSVAIQGAQSNLQHGLDRLVQQLSSVSDIWVLPSGTQNVLATTPFPATLVPELERLPGVRRVGEYRASFLTVGDRRVWVLAPPLTALNPIPSTQLLAGNLPLALARLRAGGWAVLSQALAGEHHLRIGDRFILPSSRPLSLRVAALTTNLGWPPGAIILSANDYIQGWRSAQPSAYNVMLRAGITPQRGAREVAHALGSSSALTIQTAGQRDQLQQASSRQGLSRLTQIATLVLIATILATSITMATMLTQRRPRLARAKVHGYHTAVLWRAMLLETGLLLGTACSAGAAFGIYGQLLISHALATVTGFPVLISTGAFAAVSSFLFVTVLAAAIVALPGYRAASVAPYA